MSSGQNTITNIAIVVLAVTIIVCLVLLYWFRFYFFGIKLASSAPKASWDELGYGYYANPLINTCRSETGYCTDAGKQDIIQTCIPNATTGRGCLNSKGSQTFRTKISSQVCIPQCRQSIWFVANTTDSGICTPKTGVTGEGASATLIDTCIDVGTLGFYRRQLECVMHDQVGTNGCITDVPPGYVVSDPKCTLDTSGTVLTCLVGGKTEQIVDCVPDESKFPPCGTFGAADTGATTTHGCTSGFSFNPEDVCYSLETGGETPALLSGIDKLYNFGYTLETLTCLDYIGSSITAPVNSKCKRPTSCKTSIQSGSGSILEEFQAVNTSDKIYSCIGTTTSCVKPCMYFNVGEFLLAGSGPFGAWIDILQYPVFIKIDGTYDLSVANVPCPGTNGKYMSSEISTGQVPTDLSDCFGDPAGDLSETGMIYYDPSVLVANASDYGLGSHCTASDVSTTSSTVYFVKPISISGSGTELNCKLIAIHGKTYVGKLVTQMTSAIQVAITWQKLIDTDLIKPTADFTISAPILGKYKIRSLSSQQVIVNGKNLDTCTITKVPSSVNVYGMTSTTSPATLNPVALGGTGKYEAFPNLHTFLSYRQTRQNPNTCNAYYTYPPPSGYPYFDVGEYTSGAVKFSNGA